MKKIDYLSYEKPTDFMKFVGGKNQIRIISSGGMVKKHGMRTAGGYVPLGDCTETTDCKFCLQGNEAKNKWMWICLSRPKNDVRILDCGPMIGNAICELARVRKSDPQEFDIVVTKTGEKLKSKYTVDGLPATPITPAEIENAKAAKARLIKKFFMPKTDQ